MIYLVEGYDLPFSGQASFCRNKPFFEHTKIWFKDMIYLSQNMVEGYDLPILKNLQNFLFYMV